jgi:hypothetical protein
MINKKLYKLHELYNKHDTKTAILLGNAEHSNLVLPQYVCPCGGKFFMRYGTTSEYGITEHTNDPNATWAKTLFGFMRGHRRGKDMLQFYKAHAITNLGKAAIKIAAKHYRYTK